MASAPDPIDCEGKILASTADLCGLCDQQIAIKHCVVCPVDMCVNCVKGHLKVPATRNHKLTDIKPAGYVPKSTKATASNGSCTKHGDQPFTIVCKDCVELGCDSCKTDHGGHLIQTLDNDPKLCHRVVSKNIQHLLDDVHELEEIKSVLEGQICAYDDAKLRVDQWEVDLLKLVKEKANKIRRQLKDLKDEKYKQLSDQVNGLMAKLKAIDQSIARMTAIRKSMDFTALTTSLSRSQDLIRNLEKFKEDMNPVPVPITVDDVLPNGDKVKDVDADLDVMLSVGDTRSQGPLAVAEWRFNAANGGKDLSVHGTNHVTMNNVTYGPGPRGEAQGAVVVPEIDRNWSMIVMNPDMKLRFSGEMTFFAHIFLEGTNASGFLFTYNTGVESNETWSARMYIRNHASLEIYNMNPYLSTPNVLTPNAWQRIAVVFQPTTVAVYVNDALVHTNYKPLDLSQTHQGHLHFGRLPAFTGFEGRIASCKFFDVALDENEIKKL